MVVPGPRLIACCQYQLQGAWRSDRQLLTTNTPWCRWGGAVKGQQVDHRRPSTSTACLLVHQYPSLVQYAC
jgi:hypothetical protein